MPEQMWLDDSSYAELYENAMERLHRQAPWWTHTEVSDPGIMLTEMWALLSDMQNYYLDRIKESHYRKYLKLLGIRPDPGKYAWTWVFFGYGKGAEKECVVPAGTKLLSDQMVFETEEEVHLINNHLQSFCQGSGEDLTAAMQLSRKSRLELEDREGDRHRRVLFSFVLEKPLDPQREFRFFVLLDEKNNRNAAEEGFYMAKLSWEYAYRGSWLEAEIIRDDTRGLLFSGIIVLRLNVPADGEKSGTCGIDHIRCRVGQGAYDVMPVLYKICLNAVRVFQKNTLCCEEHMVFTGDCHKLPLKTYLARTGRLWFLRKTDRDRTEAGDNGELWEDITEEVLADAPVRAGHMERYVSYGGTGHVKAVCMAAHTAPEDFTGQVTGVAAQQTALPWKRILRSSVELMIRQAPDQEGLYRACRRTDPEEDRYGNAWHWEEEEDIIVLGDGRHGEIPPPSEDGLRLTSLILWEGEKGNVSVNSINKWERPELFPFVWCTNYMAGRDGRDRKKASQQFQELKGNFLRQDRMVTEEDIRALVMKTPGLILRRAEARWRDHTVTVRVFPEYALKTEDCAEKYRSRVEQYLAPYRLAGTNLIIEIVDEKRNGGEKRSREGD